MIEDLVIVGAGGGAGDVVWLVNDVNGVAPRWRLRGILDDDPAKLGVSIAGVRVMGSIAMASGLDARFVVCIAHYRRPRTRSDVVARMGLPNDRFVTLVHPSAAVSPEARLGAGCLVFHSVLLNHRAVVGDHVVLSAASIVSHGAIVEDFATMALGAALCGGSRLARAAYAGARCVIRDGVTVGAGAVVGIGAVVVRDVQPGSVVFGNPARPVPPRDEEPTLRA
jgi:sugar O-acyltransferase (sialic acid O-acetyltransferase NeuD family)